MAASNAGGMNDRFGGVSSGHISNQGALNSNGPNAADRDFGRDRAADRANANADIDTKATRASTSTSTSADARATNSTRATNSNGPKGADRDYGYDRAQDRMSSSGSANGQAQTHVDGTAGTGTTRK